MFMHFLNYRIFFQRKYQSLHVNLRALKTLKCVIDFFGVILNYFYSNEWPNNNWCNIKHEFLTMQNCSQSFEMFGNCLQNDQIVTIFCLTDRKAKNHFDILIHLIVNVYIYLHEYSIYSTIDNNCWCKKKIPAEVYSINQYIWSCLCLVLMKTVIFYSVSLSLSLIHNILSV